LPPGTSFVGATLSGGSGLGTGTPTVSSSGGVVTLLVPGLLAPGSSAVLPTVTAILQATGTPGTVLHARLSGTGYADPAITFTAVVRVLFFDVEGPTYCYAPTNPVLASTTIT
jgi:dehydratase